MVAEVAVLAPLGWLASPLIKMLFDKAHDYLGTGIDKRRKILEATVIPRLSLAIEKAEKSPNKEKLVDWLKRLKVAYYEAEEAIDLFEYGKLKQKVKDDRKTLKQKVNNERRTRISLSSKFVPGTFKNAKVKFKKAVSIFSRQKKNAKVKFKKAVSIFSREKIMLKGCIDKLIEIAKEANEFRDLLEVQEKACGSGANRETIAELPGTVFGREIDKENIVGLLTKKLVNSEPGPSSRPAIPIIAITGRSGVGKTALARYIYILMDELTTNHKKEKYMDEQKHFDLLMWVYTPRKFNASDVIKNMIEIIKAKETTLFECTYNPTTSLQALLTQLKGMLGSKKLLLVLDDLWSDTDNFVAQWENFIGCLSGCLPGSKILLTTQSKNVAEKANLPGITEVNTYYLQDIKEDQFSELFMHYACPSSNSDLQKLEHEKIGKKIAVKLKGDPGAAKLVGRHLWGKDDLRYWEEAAEKDWLGDNMKVRIWSYEQLPLNLQRCFAICCLFPKGKMLARSVLIQLWMAEGFIRPIDKKKRLEDIGENYLDELVSRFFIEEVVDNEQGQTNYILHDLLHDLAERVQGDDLLRIDYTNSIKFPYQISSTSENIRHIFLPSNMINKLKERLCLMKNIRTFWVVREDEVIPIDVLQEILKNLKKVRILYFPLWGDELPDCIGNLKHLRYLFIDHSGPLKKLPDSICKLYHLQTLFLPNCESLPEDFSELISLRWFLAVKETMFHISHVGRLTSLQGLDQFVVRKKRGYELHQLENLNELRGQLHITGLENVASTEDAIKADMPNKKHLKTLEFEWNSNERGTDNVTSLSSQHVQLLDALQPHPNISVLTLKGFEGDIFPNWLQSQNSLIHLKSLTLMDCDKVEEISPIDELLPNCERLILQGLKNLKKMSSLPPNLTYLEIDHIPQLIYFCEADDLSKREESKLVLPSSLTILKISSCSITSDTLSTRIQCLVSLSKLELSDIHTITSLPPKEVLCSLKNLQSLTIKECYLLSSLGGIGALTSLIALELNGCLNLNTSNELLPSSLESINFSNCSNVDVILSKSDLPVLRSLVIINIMFEGVLHVGYLSHLEELTIVRFDGRLEGLNSLTTLSNLCVRDCPEIKPPSPMDKYASELPTVSVDDPLLLKLLLSNKTISSIETLGFLKFQADSSDDEVFQYLTSLRCLLIILCNITHLPENLKNLASLRVLSLDNCPNLCELEELPRNLRFLEIKDCPSLTEKFNEGGPYRVEFDKGSTIVTF